MHDRRKFLTVMQVAEMYAVSTRKVYSDIARGFLPAYTVGSSIRIREHDAHGYAREVTPGVILLSGKDLTE